jgi:D-alanyl-D-alanine carboxypeptidase
MKIKKTYYIVWVLIAFLVGVSIFSFAYDMGQKVATHFFGSQSPQLAHINGNVVLATTTALQSKGSQDVEDAVSSELSDQTVYSLKAQAGLPKVTSKEYLVGDITTGKIILEKNATTTYPLASITKLMTALVSREDDNPHEITTISQTAVATYGTEGELSAGEKMVVGDLFYPMLLESSNDAAEALAEHFGRTDFLFNMNKKAETLGMTSTHYDDASGLSAKNVTTAADLFKLVRYINVNQSDIYDITRVRGYDILGHDWLNHNHFLNLSTFIGGKNGYTDEALYTTVANFSLPIRITNGTSTVKHNISIILLQSQSREIDVQAILNYIKNNVTLDVASSTLQ